MPSFISLEAIPNQEFSIRLDDIRYTLRFNDVAPGCLCATISNNATTVISGVRCVAGRFIIPYEYLEGEGGNFYFETPDDEIPDYEKFGATHNLLYFSADELRGMRG